MYCIQYDEICKKHNFELKHDALGERVTLEYPADSVPKDTIRLFQNHLPEGVSAMAEKYSSDRFAIFKYNAAAAAGNTIGLTETLEKNKKVSAALSDLADDLKQAELEAKTWVCIDAESPDDAIEKVSQALNNGDVNMSTDIANNIGYSMRNGHYEVTDAIPMDE